MIIPVDQLSFVRVLEYYEKYDLALMFNLFHRIYCL